jgi:hypothetical protein
MVTLPLCPPPLDKGGGKEKKEGAKPPLKLPIMMYVGLRPSKTPPPLAYIWRRGWDSNPR